MRWVWSFLWRIQCISHLKARWLWHLLWEQLGTRAGGKCTSPLRSQHSWSSCTAALQAARLLPSAKENSELAPAALAGFLGRMFPPHPPWTRQLGVAMKSHLDGAHPVCCFWLWSPLQLQFSNLLDLLHWCLSWRGPRAKAVVIVNGIFEKCFKMTYWTPIFGLIKRILLNYFLIFLFKILISVCGA